MKALRVFSATVLLLGFGATAAVAHHSAAPFNFQGPAVIEGTVKQFNVLNPHSAVVLEVTDDERGTRDIEFEGMSASVFYRAGYTNDAVKAGDKIQITIAPRHDGEDGGFIVSFVTADGQDIGFREL